MNRKETMERIKRITREPVKMLDKVLSLTDASLVGAVLNGSDLRGADLSRADLSRADLRGADLTRADLTGATGDNFCTANFGNHSAVAAGGYISIGCERHTYDYWLANYEEIGRKHGYALEKIELYGAWIRLAVKWLGGKDE